MIKPKIFLAHSFGDNRIDFFKNLLEEQFIVLTGEESERTTVYENTLRKIDESVAVFAIFSREDKIEGRREWGTSSAVIFETGYAIGKNKPVFCIREEGVDPIRRTGMAYFFSPLGSDSSLNVPAIFPRSKKDLENKKEEIKGFILSVKEKIVKRHSLPYYYSSIQKKVRVCHGGYGVIKQCYTIHIDKEGLFDVKSIPHLFSLDGSAIKGSEVSGIDEMYTAEKPFSFKKDMRFFFSAQSEKNPIKPILLSSGSKKEIKFEFNFSGPFSRGQEIKYEWVIGGPGLFPISSLDLEPGKREKDLKHVESGFKIPSSPEIDKVEYIIIFEQDVSVLLREPVFTKYDASDTKIEEETADDIKRDTLETCYSKYYSSYTIPSGKIIATWKPK